jgi:hypothetical protein
MYFFMDKRGKNMLSLMRPVIIHILLNTGAKKKSRLILIRRGLKVRLSNGDNRYSRECNVYIS